MAFSTATGKHLAMLRRSLLCGAAAMAWLFVPAVQAVVLSPGAAQTLERRIDAFVAAPGFAPLDIEAMLDDDWYARFDRAGRSALPPDAGLDPVTRGMLLFASAEAPLDTARYRITRHQRSLGGDWSDVRHSYIEIVRYNLAPGLHRDNVATYGGHAAPASPAVQLPHVAWRLVTTGRMGQRAAVVAASRRVVGPFEASRAICLDRLPCLALGGFAFDAANAFEPMPAPALAAAGYRGATVPPDRPATAIAPPARIAQEMFRIAAGEHDELHEGATLANPEMVLVIGFGSGGQERNSQALMHLTSLMDDATAERWIRRRETPGALEWQRLDVAVPRRPATPPH